MSDTKQPPGAHPMTDMFNRIAEKAGKTTIMQPAPTGEFMIWMTAKEMNPVAALLSAALSIMVKRGDNAENIQGVSIRKVMDGLIAPGCDYFWKVTDSEGKDIAQGYAASENEAATKMLPYLSSL